MSSMIFSFNLEFFLFTSYLDHYILLKYHSFNFDYFGINELSVLGAGKTI